MEQISWEEVKEQMKAKVEAAKALVKTVIGESKEAAVKMLEAAGLKVHVDGDGTFVTRDLREDRVTLTVVDGKVSDAKIG